MSNCQNIAEHDDIHEIEIHITLINKTCKKALIKRSKCMKMTVDYAGKEKT